MVQTQAEFTVLPLVGRAMVFASGFERILGSKQYSTSLGSLPQHRSWYDENPSVVVIDIVLHLARSVVGIAFPDKVV